MKLTFDLPATLLLYFSMPNFFSFVGIALAIINQLHNISVGVKKDGGFKPYFQNVISPYLSALNEWYQKDKNNG